ncbi:RNA polymerase-binding transcription factor DksA [Halomonas sp. THAF5a]|uniref:TraR/DksA family transcriptional regulator n=1 Tax=Halomonas sp. THAF5a TaxID=2587844 RepID=UPI001267E437|nr:TraR/DksA C4-type zinc finger protein [Halomonas sp. THAF5a]QFU00898.1 RNA polymerase-binding transcription factor DksA [Halomonas sp. THAF5a]
MADRKQELEALREELVARLDRYQAHREQKGAPLDKDTEDASTETVNDEVIQALQQEAEDELRQVLHALKRLAAGEGDACEQCGEPIGDARLRALPYTTHCRRCAERL